MIYFLPCPSHHPHPSGPTVTVILSRYTVALHSLACCFRAFGGVSHENRATPLSEKEPCSTYHFSSQRGCRTSSCLLEGVAVQQVCRSTTPSPVALQWATWIPIWHSQICLFHTNMSHPLLGLLQREPLVAHTCSDPNRATQCRAHNVAADSRSFRDVTGMSRYTPPKDRVAPVFPTPPVAVVFGVFWKDKNRRKIAGGGCHTGSVKISFRQWIALHGGVAATLTPIALHCATKREPALN